MKIKISRYTLPLLLALSLPAFASVTVNNPGNGAEVSSPFNLSADASTCSSQPVSAMGFSLDSSSSTTIINGTSVNASVTATVGTHTLHVKAWGNKGAACDTDVAISVQTAVSANVAVAASNAITISSPGQGSTVISPFSLVAGAATCSSQPVSAMGYSLDSSTNTAIVNTTAIGATVTAAAGAHTLHVKAWGNQGAACDTDVPITVTVPVAAVASVSNTVAVNSPANGASVSSPFDVTASAATCSSQPVSAMGYSLDSSTDTTIVNSASLSGSVAASAGAHTLHVKAWGNQGAACDTDVAVTVGGGSGTAATSLVPSDAVSVSAIQALSNWTETNDSATSGSSQGNTNMDSSPSLSGNAREFTTKFSNSGGERYEVSFGDDTSATNFLYDGWVYLTSSSSQISNLEMDMNQTMANGQTAIFGFQCDGYTSTWDYTANKGTPQNPSDQWIHSTQPCNVRNWSTNTWHHVQVSYSRDSSGNITYQSVWLDGVQQSINATVPSAFALGWAPTLLTNFQVDGLGTSGTATVYLDNLVIYRW